MKLNYQDIVLRKDNLEKYGPGGYSLHMKTLQVTPILPKAEITGQVSMEKAPDTGMPELKL